MVQPPNQVNDNLEQQAQSYFQELFVDNADPEWTTGTISDLGTVVGGSTPSKAKPEYYTESGIAWITPKDLSINKSKFVVDFFIYSIENRNNLFLRFNRGQRNFNIFQVTNSYLRLCRSRVQITEVVF